MKSSCNGCLSLLWLVETSFVPPSSLSGSWFWFSISDIKFLGFDIQLFGWKRQVSAWYLLNWISLSLAVRGRAFTVYWWKPRVDISFLLLGNVFQNSRLGYFKTGSEVKIVENWIFENPVNKTLAGRRQRFLKGFWSLKVSSRRTALGNHVWK